MLIIYILTLGILPFWDLGGLKLKKVHHDVLVLQYHWHRLEPSWWLLIWDQSTTTVVFQLIWVARNLSVQADVPWKLNYLRNSCGYNSEPASESNHGQHEFAVYHTKLGEVTSWVSNSSDSTNSTHPCLSLSMNRWSPYWLDEEATFNRYRIIDAHRWKAKCMLRLC